MQFKEKMTDKATRDMALEILQLFGEKDTEGWDLHAFFELVAGDNRERREAVLGIVDRLVEDCYLLSRGGDFYTLTDKGVRAVRRGEIW